MAESLNVISGKDWEGKKKEVVNFCGNCDESRMMEDGSLRCRILGNGHLQEGHVERGYCSWAVEILTETRGILTRYGFTPFAPNPPYDWRAMYPEYSENS